MNPSTETSGITRRSLAETYEAQDLIIQAAQDAKRDATKAYREQLDGAGMDKDAIKSEVEGFKLAYRRKVAVEKKGSDEVEHRDAIADEIYLEITSPAPRATRVATTVPDGFDPETGEEITEPQEAQAPAQASDAQAANLPASTVAATSLPGAEGAEDRDTIQPETANEFGGVSADVSNPNDGGENEDAAEPAVDPLCRRQFDVIENSSEDRTHEVEVATTSAQTVTGEGAPNASVTPLYSAPGVVVMETCPPEGALAHPYAACWPVRDIDVSEGVREPIVKIGKLILDGRGRMFAARGWDGGKGREYPVVQYDGTDPLLDCIRWNLASRPGIHAHNLKLIAGKLCKLEPTRADEIMQAFGLEVAEAAE